MNAEVIPAPKGGSWNESKVRSILRKEVYVGTLIYNKTRSKLKTKKRANPKDKWIRTPEAFEPIVSGEIFDQAQAILRGRHDVYTVEHMLDRLRLILDTHGFIRASLIRSDADAPSPSTYVKRFASLDAACQRLFAGSLDVARQQVVDRLRGVVAEVDSFADFLVVNRRFTVMVKPVIPLQYGYTEYWFMQPDPREVIDITLCVPLSTDSSPSILGYLAMPRLLTGKRPFRLFSTSESPIDMYGHDGLELIRQLTL